MAYSLATRLIMGILTTIGTEPAKRALCYVLEEFAKMTETTLDDELVKMLKKAWGLE